MVILGTLKILMDPEEKIWRNNGNYGNMGNMVFTHFIKKAMENIVNTGNIGTSLLWLVEKKYKKISERNPYFVRGVKKCPPMLANTTTCGSCKLPGPTILTPLDYDF